MSQRIGNNGGATIGGTFSNLLGMVNHGINGTSDLMESYAVGCSVVLQKTKNFAEVSKVTDAANLALVKAEIAIQLAAVAESADSVTAAKLNELDLG
jgi:hypothetical protein